MSPLNPGLIQGTKPPAANQNEPGRRQRHPLLRAPSRVFRRVDLAGFKIVHQFTAAPAVRRSFDFFRTGLGGQGKLKLVVPCQEIVPADLLAEGKAQGIDEEVPRLVLFLNEAACAQTRHVADRSCQYEHVQFRPAGIGGSWILPGEKRGGELIWKNPTYH